MVYGCASSHFTLITIRPIDELFMSVRGLRARVKSIQRLVLSNRIIRLAPVLAVGHDPGRFQNTPTPHPTSR